MTAHARAAGPDRTRRPRRLQVLLAARGLGLFAEVVSVSLAVALCSLAAVTALPAAAAGAARLRRHIDGDDDSVRGFVRDLGRALRYGWVAGAIAAVAAFGLLVNLTSDALAVVPGGEAVRALSIVASIIAALVLLRAAALWSADERWGPLIRRAAAETASDPRGTAMLLLAIVLATVIVWMFAPLVVLVPGMLLFAAVSITRTPAAHTA